MKKMLNIDKMIQKNAAVKNYFYGPFKFLVSYL